VRQHALTIGAGLVAVVLLVAGRVSVDAAVRAIDLDLLLVLFALLIAVDLLRSGGVLDLAVARTVERFHTTRSFAVALIAFSGVLAAIVTNDVTLFVVVPFTVAASRAADFDVEDAVILEIVATNLVGCLTPLGNPQNLFVFHRSGWTAAHFIVVMAPFVAWSVAGLLAAIFLLGRSCEMPKRAISLQPLDRKMALAGAATLVLVLCEIARILNAWPAAIIAAISATLLLKKRALRIDYSIVPLFLFAFIVVESMRSIHVRGAEDHLYGTSIALSQFVSNVPATVLLSPFTAGRWRELLYGVNAGGCGTIIASLANLLGWRIYVRESGRDPRFFRRLTFVNFAFLAWIATGGWVLLSATR
jgi:Na+/H+ antiporter NhaD/arsenite permease-like protein